MTADPGYESVSPGGSDALVRDLKAEAGRLGFARVGITDVRPSEHAAFYRRWLERGYHGEMGYLARPDALGRREDLRGTNRGAGSVVVVADAYSPEDAPAVPRDPSLGVVARYARGADYHRVLRRRLERLGAWLGARLGGEGARRRGRVCVDTAPVLERELARRAGIGWFGRNTMLIDPLGGSYFLLGALILDVPLPPDAPFAEDRCGSCQACLEACPTGALLGRDAAGAPVIDARRCISYLTIELRGPIPHDLRPAIGNRVFGCDICQEVCPWNRRFPAAGPWEPRYAARGPGEPPAGVEGLPGEVVTAGTHPGTRAPSLIALMETALDGERWEAFSRASPLRRPGRAGFARNVAVALGNWSAEEAVPVLARALADPEVLIRCHSAWALGRVGSSAARRALVERLAVEGSEEVREELERALT